MYKTLLRAPIRDATVFEVVAALVSATSLHAVLYQIAWRMLVADATYNMPATQLKIACLVFAVSATMLVGLLMLRLRRTR